MDNETQAVTGLKAQIAAYEQMRNDLEVEHLDEPS